MNSYIWIGITGGILAFAHCVGMCGGFVLHLAQEQDRKRMVAGQFLWHAGRISAYVFLGALAGYAGGVITGFLQHTWLQNVFSYITGIIIVVMGASVLGLLPLQARNEKSGQNIFDTILTHPIFTASSGGSALLLGIVTGFLPCPIVLGFLAYAVKSGSVADGMAVMAGMGAGTIAPLLLLGATGHWIGLHARRWGAVAGGIILLVLGISTILRGTPVCDRLGCSTLSVQHLFQDAPSPCCRDKAHAPPVIR